MTTITTQSGDDTVFVSSEANQNMANALTVDVLLGWLDYIQNDLIVSVDTGRHRLLISDEKSQIAKGKGQTGEAIFTSQSLTSLGDGLGDIFFSASGNGNWFGGVNVWLGYGNDRLDVLSIPNNANTSPSRTTTSFHAGDGDDVILVSLAAEDHDGALFVANGQAGNDRIDASTSTHPVILFGDMGNDILIGGSNDDIVVGDFGRVIWKGGPHEEIYAQVGKGGYEDFTDGLFHTVSEVNSRATALGGMDRIITGDGDNVAIGGQGDDYLEGGNHRDILVGSIDICGMIPKDFGVGN